MEISRQQFNNENNLLKISKAIMRFVFIFFFSQMNAIMFKLSDAFHLTLFCHHQNKYEAKLFLLEIRLTLFR